MAVFVLDRQQNPLMPCSEKRARLLLQRGRAVVVRLAPFTIRLKDRVGGDLQPLRIKLDPGSRTTGIALGERKLEALQRMQAQAKAPLKDAAAVNTTRWALFAALKATGLPVETGSGGRTKFNPMRLGVPKTHALDTACVGRVDSLSGARGGAGVRQFQPSDRRWRRPGHLLPSLPNAPASRWLWLFVQP